MIIASFNIGRCRFSSPERVSQLISEISPDIIFLQEVDRYTERSAGIDQHEEIKKACCFESGFFCQTLFLEKDQYYGISALSNIKTNFSTVNLSFYGDDEPRFAIKASISTECIQLHFYGVHLSQNSGIAAKQIHVLNDISKKAQEKSLIIGDYNLETDSVSIKGLLTTDLVPTWTDGYTSKKIDHIVSQGIETKKHKVVLSNGVSDHNLITCEI